MQWEYGNLSFNNTKGLVCGVLMETAAIPCRVWSNNYYPCGGGWGSLRHVRLFTHLCKLCPYEHRRHPSEIKGGIIRQEKCTMWTVMPLLAFYVLCAIFPSTFYEILSRNIICMFLCMFVCMYVCMYICMYVLLYITSPDPAGRPKKHW